MSNPLDGQTPLTPIPDQLPAPTPIEATVEPLEIPPHLQDQDFDDTFVEYGLKGPDGTVYWGQFCGTSLATPADRYLSVVRLRQTAVDLGQHIEPFVNSYSWVGRSCRQVVHRSYTDAGEVPIDSTAAAPPPAQ